MKKKNFFAKIVSMISMLAIIVTCVAAIPAYAMENDSSESDIQAYASNGYADIPTYVTIPYATTYHIFDADPNDGINRYGYEFTNNKNLGTVTLADDARIHRFKIKLWFAKGYSDNGPSDSLVKLTLKITRGNGTTKTVVVEPNGPLGYYDSEWFLDAYAGEKITLWVDASTATGYTGNGNYRSLQFTDFQIYCD